MHINTQCLLNKIKSVEHLTTKLKPNILCINEHWMNDNNCNLYNINGYSNIASFNRSKHIHGGVCIFCEDTLECEPLANIQAMSIEKNCELAAIYIKSQNLAVVSSYRSPNGDIKIYLNIIEEIITTIYNMFNNNINIILSGDFNVNLLIDANSPDKRALLNSFTSLGLDQTVFTPTRIQGNSKTCVDNFFTNAEEYKITTHGALISDHEIIMIGMESHCTKSHHERARKKIRIFSEAATNQFILRLKEEDWHDIFITNDPNEKYKMFLNTYLRYYEESFPLKTQSIKSNHRNMFPMK